MVKYTYTPSPFDFDQQTIALLKQIWNFNTHSDKAICVDCLAREEWCIERVRQKWKPDFVCFDSTIRKIRARDRCFIDFDTINLWEMTNEQFELLLKNNFF